MKRIIALLVLGLLTQSCATIVGGRMYNAHIKIENDPHAQIYYHGQYKGSGAATFKVERKMANELYFQVKKEGCEPEDFRFYERKFRGWAFTGSLVFWTGIYFIPWGIILDGITGAWWKPDIGEGHIMKQNWDNYHYLLRLSGCGEGKQGATYGNWDMEVEEESTSTKEKRLTELKSLYEKELITEEEYIEQKQRILNEDN